MSIRAGTRLGVDVGTVRIGLARSDHGAILATPLKTLPRGSSAIAEVVRIAAETDAIEIVVGLPLTLSGASTASTQDAVAFARKLARVGEVPVRLVDERLSTVSAQRDLRTVGRNSRQSRPVIDQVAATIILQHALDVERSSGTPPGELITLDEG